MTMTPQEKRVVQEAIKASRTLGGLFDTSPLGKAVSALVYACPECNYDRHTCPGCGASIQHGDGDCGQDCTDSGLLTTTQREEREHLRRQLEKIGQGTVQEWMRIVELETPDIALTGHARVNWKNSNGECIVGESPYGEEYGRFRITVHVEDLGPVPSIGPENDLGLYGIVDERPGEPVSAGQDEDLERQGREMAEDPPIWVSKTLRDAVAGDTIRMPGQPDTERTIAGMSPVLPWHVHPAGGRDAEFHPERYRAEWSQVMVSFGGDPLPLDPAMPIEIRTTAAELRAIEALGGWDNRLQVNDSAPNPSGE